MIWANFLYFPINVFELWKTYFKVSSLGVRTNSIDSSFSFAERDVIFLVCNKWRSHNFVNVILVLSNRLFFFNKLSFKVVFIFTWLYCGLDELRLYFTVNDLINRDVSVHIFWFGSFLLLIEFISICNFWLLFVVIRVVFDIMFESYFHVFHSFVEVTNLANLFFLALQIPKFDYFLSFSWLRINFYTEDRQTNDFTQIHVAFSINLNLKSMIYLFLRLIRFFFFSWLSHSFTHTLRSSFFINWNVYFLCYQKLSFFLGLLWLERWFQWLRLNILVGILLIDYLNWSFKYQS